MAKALGYATGQQDAWSQAGRRVGPGAGHRASCPTTTSPTPVLELAAEVEHFPRHLGIHSGGMVICDRPVDRGVPGRVGPLHGRNGTGTNRSAPCCSGTRTTAPPSGW